MKKSLVLLALLFVFTSLVSAWSIADFPDQTATYGQDNTITLECDGNDCPVPSSSYGGGSPGMGLVIDGCRKLQNYAFTYDSGNTMSVTYNIPREYVCGVGKYGMRVVYGGNTRARATLNVRAKNMDPHKGQHLYIVSDIDQGELRGFMLSNDVWADTINPFWGNKQNPSIDPCVTLPGGEGCYNSGIMIEELDLYSGNEYAAWDPAFGGRIKGISDSLESIVKGDVFDGKENYQGGSIGDGSCSNDPCAIGKADFTTVNGYTNMGKYAGNLDSATPVHFNGNRMPDGEVIFGEEPVSYNSSGDQYVDSYGYNPSRKFFVCREGATMDNGFGDQVPQVVDVAEDYSKQGLVQCEWSTGMTGGKYNFRWESVGACQDGLDNDGDGNIDHPNSDVTQSVSSDPSCSSMTDAESGSGACTPAVGFNGTNYVAYYGGASDGGSENYCDGSNGKTQTFEQWINNIPGSNGQVPSAQVITCDEGSATGYCANRDYYIHDDKTSTAGAQINYVKYYPTVEYFKNGIDTGTTAGLYNGEKTASHFVDGNGWTPGKMALDGGSYKGDGIKPSDRQGAERIYGAVDSPLGRHSGSFWFGTKGMVDGDGNGYKSGSYDDSWVVANAGAPNNNQISSKFFGGFAGKCPQGTEWKKQAGEWQCSGEPNWKQAVFLPKVSSGTDKIGIAVMPYNFRDTEASANLGIRQNLRLTSWKTAYDRVSGNTADSGQTLKEMKVSCYPGNSQPDYSTATKGQDYFNDTVSIPTDVQSPVGTSGTVDMSGHTTYTCEWSYTTAGGDKVSSPGCVIELQKTQTNCRNVDFTAVKNYFMDKKYSDGTVLKLDKKYSSEDLTGLIG